MRFKHLCTTKSQAIRLMDGEEIHGRKIMVQVRARAEFITSAWHLCLAQSSAPPAWCHLCLAPLPGALRADCLALCFSQRPKAQRPDCWCRGAGVSIMAAGAATAAWHSLLAGCTAVAWQTQTHHHCMLAPHPCVPQRAKTTLY